MAWLEELWRRLLILLRWRQYDRDLEEEMRFHLEMKAEESGSAEAHRQFGNATLLREDVRQAWGWAALEAWAADVKYAFRSLQKNPGFTAVAVLTLMLGIGASTAVFSVVHAVLLRPLPYPDAGRLAMIWEKREHRGEDRVVVSYPIFQDWKRQSGSFEQMGVYVGDSVRTTENGEPTYIDGAMFSAGTFRALGVQPRIGRTFLPEEERRNGPKVMVLSHELWQRLGGDRKLVGKTVQFDRETYTITGIMPKGFAFPSTAEYWVPFAGDDPRNDGSHYLRVVGRIQSGVTMAQAQSEMRAIAARLQAAHPKENEGIGANVVPLLEQTVGEARRALLVLLGAVACVLLIACANIANLLLVRATARRREFALRLSLGAGRWRIARWLLTESVMLAVVGGAFGVAASYWLLRAFVALDPIHLPRIHDVAIDGTVLLYAVGAAIVTGLLLGLAPALHASAPDLGNWLKEGPGAPGAGEFGKNRGRSLLAAAQIALAVTLLITGGLLLRSFVARVSVPLGFRPEGVLAVDLPWSVRDRVDELLTRLRSLPGVQAAGAATAFPLDAAGTSCGGCLEIEGRPKERGRERDTGYMVATAEYFAAAGMPIRRGRSFTAADRPDGPKVVVINEALARRDFANQDPLGRRLRWSSGDWATIIGVAANVKGFGVAGDPMPSLYFRNGQESWGNPVQVLVRTTVPPASLAGAVRKEIRTWNKRLIIGKLATMETMLEESVAAPKFYMMLVAGFALLALVVAAVGVYGTVNYSVARRTHEIGIRMALGAARRDVLGMVFGQGLSVTAAGLALGLAGAWASTRVLENLLFGIKPSDGVAFACGSGVLVIAVLLACWFPARRATRVDPLEALRHE
jgi:putative ABC transport system permease protein